MMVFTFNEDRRSAARIQCDTCGRPIENAERAAVAFTPEMEETTRVFFVHKGGCHDFVDAAHARQYGLTALPWIELERWFDQLLFNTGSRFAPEEDPRRPWASLP